MYIEVRAQRATEYKPLSFYQKILQLLYPVKHLNDKKKRRQPVPPRIRRKTISNFLVFYTVRTSIRTIFIPMSPSTLIFQAIYFLMQSALQRAAKTRTNLAPFSLAPEGSAFGINPAATLDTGLWFLAASSALRAK